MNIKSFMNQVAEINDLKKLPDTFWNRRKLRKAKKVLDNMVRAAAQEEAEKMFKQAYDFYYDFINNNLA